MTARIQNASGSTQIVPTVAQVVTMSNAGQSIFHTVIGSAFPDITLRDAGPSTGTITCVFGSATAEQDSTDAWAALRQADTWTYSDTDAGSVGISFVVTGLSRSLDTTTRAVWLLTVEFQEA